VLKVKKGGLGGPRTAKRGTEEKRRAGHLLERALEKGSPSEDLANSPAFPAAGKSLILQKGGKNERENAESDKGGDLGKHAPNRWMVPEPVERKNCRTGKGGGYRTIVKYGNRKDH